MYHLLALGKADAFESVSKKNVFECLHLLMSGRLMVYTPQSSARQNEACLVEAYYITVPYTDAN